MKILTLVAAIAMAGCLLFMAASDINAAGVKDMLTGQICDSANKELAGCEGGLVLANPDDPKKSYVSILLDGFIALTVIIATIFLILGGFNYITSEGESSKVTSAKKTVLYAMIGIVVAVLARPIAAYIINAAKVP